MADTVLKNSALVVLSGGQDSTTCLYWALKEFERVETVTFDYGQRHRLEIESALKIADLAGAPNTLLRLSGLTAIGGSSLTDNIDVSGECGPSGLPNTFVPGRNILFLCYAAALGYQKGIHDLVIGVCQTDYSGYPDCRQTAIDSLSRTLELGMDMEIRIHTPLMQLSKGQSILLAKELGALTALAFSHTCYNGRFPPCGECAACQLRQKGFQEAGCVDPLIQRAESET